jgi:hypothetical protein
MIEIKSHHQISPTTESFKILRMDRIFHYTSVAYLIGVKIMPWFVQVIVNF